MDPFAEAFGNIGADFEELFAPLLKPVTVVSVDPDKKAVPFAVVSEVPALKRGRRRQMFAVGGGGELGADGTRFVITAARLSFALKEKDRITGADGVAWVVTDLELIAFGQVYTANVERAKG